MTFLIYSYVLQIRSCIESVFLQISASVSNMVGNLKYHPLQLYKLLKQENVASSVICCKYLNKKQARVEPKAHPTFVVHTTGDSGSMTPESESSPKTTIQQRDSTTTRSTLSGLHIWASSSGTLQKQCEYTSANITTSGRHLAARSRNSVSTHQQTSPHLGVI